MKKHLVTIIILIITTASLSSQNLFPKKIKYQGFDAVVISVPQMDSISVKIYKLKIALSENAKIKLQLSAALQELNIFKKELELLNLEYSSNEELHEKEVEKLLLLVERKDIENDYLKDKSKGGFTNFIFGTTVGGLIAALLAIIFN